MANFSPALKRFRARLKEVDALLSLCESNNVSLSRRSRARKKDDALCRASIVLLCSHIEGFFEDLIEDTIKFHELNNTQIAKLPIQLKVTQIWGRANFSDGLDDSKKWDIIQNVLSNNITNNALSCNLNDLDCTLHTKGFANPGSNDVEKLYRSVGIDNIWGRIEQLSPRDRHLKQSLNSMVARRHPIAHGDANATGTPADIKNFVLIMKRLTILFDVIVVNHIQDDLGYSNPWLLFP